jgi:cobalt-zinc-cadmium efflux system outer membrane protein
MAKGWLRGVTALLLASGGTLPASSGAQERPLTLDEVYRIAREDARRAMEPSAGLPPDPVLQLGVMNFSLPGFETDMPTSMTPSIQAMQMLPIGKLGLTRRLAEQSTALSASAEREEAWEVRSRAAMAFYELWQATREIEVMRETLGWLENFEAVAKAMYVSGEASQSDVLRAGVEISRMEADIERMQAMKAGSAARLNAVLGRPADTPVSEVVIPSPQLWLPSADTLRASAEQHRPMLEGGRTEVEQTRTRSALVRREIWPDLTVGFEYGQRSAPPDEMGESRIERMGSVMVGFSLPVFAGKRQLRMRDEARAMQSMAEADLAAMRVEVDARIGELLADLTRSRELIELYRSNVLPQARAMVSSALSSYRVGRVDFMTLVDAQMTNNEYEQELAVLLSEYGVAFAELEMTIGRELSADDAGAMEGR